VNQTTTVDFALEAFAMPEGLSCIVFDYNDVELTWDVPETNGDVPEISRTKSVTRSTMNIGKTEESVADNTRDITGYKVYRDGVEIAEITDPAILTYTDLALATGDYDYYITAIYDIGESLPSNVEPVIIILPTPQNPQAETQGADIFVSWDVPANRALSHYKVYRNLVVVADDIAETSYLDPDVPNGTYTYNIRAVYSGDHQSALSVDAVIEHVQVNSNEVLIPANTELTGNYPNPFNPETTISYSIKEDSRVSLFIYNIKGQKVRSLINGPIQTGYHTVTWNGKNDNGENVSSGIYFSIFDAVNNEKDYTSVKKIILLK
jgi:flagellar hook assembly protein FlgD